MFSKEQRAQSYAVLKSRYERKKSTKNKTALLVFTYKITLYIALLLIQYLFTVRILIILRTSIELRSTDKCSRDPSKCYRNRTEFFSNFLFHLEVYKFGIQWIYITVITKYLPYWRHSFRFVFFSKYIIEYSLFLHFSGYLVDVGTAIE